MSADASQVSQQANGETPAASSAVEGKADSGVQKRINELTRARYDQQRRAEAAEARVAEFEKASKQTQASTQSEPRKMLADFNYDDVAYEDYLAERVTRRAESSAAKKAEEVVVEREQTKARETTAAERKAKWTERVKEFSKDHPDFEEHVYAEHVEFSDAVAEAIADSDIGPQLAYHLAQNPDQARRISSLSAAAAGREIGRLEAKLSVEAPTKEVDADADENASAKEPPKAEPSLPRLKPSGNTTLQAPTTSSQSDKLSDEAWFKAENKRVASLRAKR